MRAWPCLNNWALWIYLVIQLSNLSWGNVRLPTNSNMTLVKIVGGTQADIQIYPYQVSMQYGGRHICGGSILSVNYVITAAHCTYKISASQVSFRAGSSKRTEGGQIVKAKAVHQHPKFNYNTVDYDVALVEVAPKFSYNQRLKNIGIGTREPGEGTKVTASGWGTLRETSNRLPTELRAVEVPIVSRANCKKIYSRRATITDRMICAGVLFRGGKDSCQGDSGGPLVLSGKLVGVVSWGFGCGRRKYPGVYTNLNNKEIRSYIKRITRI